MEEFLKTRTTWFSSETLAILQENWVAIPNWKWIVLAILFVIAIIALPALQYVFGKIKKAPHWKPKSFLAFLQGEPSEKPPAGILVCLILLAGIDAIAPGGNLQKYLSLLVQITLVFYIIRLLYICVDALGHVLVEIASKTSNTLDDQLAPMATKTMKIAIVILGVLVALQNFGVNVASILAGLGLGGLAFALAAKDTAANLFGSITILLDAPFKIGDTIKIGDTEGTVEDIGFRSTRIRTLYNSLVTIPNSVVANEKIDNTGMRARRRVRQVLSLVYETAPDQIQKFCETVTAHLQKTKQVEKDSITVTFNNFNAASLDVLLNFHLINIDDVKEEQKITQRLFLDILEIAAKMKVDFAYPTQTLYLKGPLETKTATPKDQRPPQQIV